MKTVLVTITVCLITVFTIAVAFVWRGWYDVSATTSHTGPVYALIEMGLHRGVKLRAAQVDVPPLDGASLRDRGASCYQAYCEQCHGAPGVSQQDIGLGLQPLPGPLVDVARRWRPAEIYWITRHGIKMTGMPAWEARFSEDDLWAITAFLLELPDLSAQGYRRRMEALEGPACSSLSQACREGDCARADAADARPLQVRDDDEAARLLLRQYACAACHRIAGLVGPDSDVGPPLAGLWRRDRIAGGPATEAHLIRWLQAPGTVRPGTAMPDLGVTEAHARRMAAYLLDRRR